MYITKLKNLINPLICQNNNELYYEICQMPSTNVGEINLLVMCNEELLGHVVVKSGIIDNILRTLLNIRAHVYQNKFNINFEVL